MAPRLYILTGISFSGKSTLAQAIVKAQNIPIIDPDSIAHEQGIGLEGEIVDDAQWVLIHKEAERRAAQILIAGGSLVYDTTAFTRQQRQELRSLATQHNAVPVLIFVSINRNKAWQRWSQNNQTQERFAVHEDDFNMVADNFEPPGSDEPHLVYGVGQNLADWVDQNIGARTMS
jgi:predicted kinase